MNRLHALLAGAALAAALTAVATPAEASTRVLVLPACVYEDGSGGATPCVWDGATMGNGTGDSYIARGAGGPFEPLPTRACTATVMVGCDSGYRTWVQTNGVPLRVA